MSLVTNNTIINSDDNVIQYFSCGHEDRYKEVSTIDELAKQIVETQNLIKIIHEDISEGEQVKDVAENVAFGAIMLASFATGTILGPIAAAVAFRGVVDFSGYQESRVKVRERIEASLKEKLLYYPNRDDKREAESKVEKVISELCQLSLENKLDAPTLVGRVEVFQRSVDNIRKKTQ